MSRSGWLSAREAASFLDVKLSTLYAYASRGLVESVPGPHGRGRRYDADSLALHKARQEARSGHGPVAAAALRFGEPILETSISDIRSDGPYYRGHALHALCRERRSFESVAELLWHGAAHEPWPSRPFKLPLRRPRVPSPNAYLAAAVACAALLDEQRHGASDREEHTRARRLIAWLASIVGGAPVRAQAACSIAERVLAGYGVKASTTSLHAVDRALIVCADHELNPSTFAVRVTASAGADLYACLGAGFHALSGVRHGGVTAQVEALLDEIRTPARAASVVRDRLARGERIPGFGHKLYPEGDPRARMLLALAKEARPQRSLAVLEALVAAMKKARQPAPNLDAGLIAVRCALGLPRGAASGLFAIGRSAGWVAHALEQRARAHVLRPRARYVASPPLAP